MITLCEDKTGSNFKYRANIDTVSGERLYMVLPQVENFLYKLDMVQREMHKDPAHFVPVKYGAAEEADNRMTDVVVGLGLASLLLLMYRSMHG